MTPVTPTPPSASPQNTARLRELSLHQQPTTPPQLAMRSNHSPSQQDEGYSEDPSGSPPPEHTAMALDADFNMISAAGQQNFDGLLTLSLAKRIEIVKFLITTLPNAQKAEMSTLIERLTHFDPTIYLPNEIVLQIFSYLPPRDLLSASRVSRAFRIRSHDERLWRLCFAREGWQIDRERADAFEKIAEERGKRVAECIVKKRAVPERPAELERRESRKRGRDEAFNEDEQMHSGQVDEPSKKEAAMEHVQAERSPDGSDEEHMEGVQCATPPPPYSKDSPPADYFTDEPVYDPAKVQVEPPVFQPASAHPYNLKLSWPYLYKQRRRLESNWDHGRYKMFQLPHPDHPEEGHEECVYTIQHTPRHLVSGSRDKSIRIWDLESQRLKGKPLHGHEASVLCLQFDERPEQDIIVSGGSDARVIVWKFSTGHIIKTLHAAHDESVLNLRFDDRYIVTCSKDKTIKVWSRHELAKDSPLIPRHVLSEFESAGPGAGRMIAEYTLLTTLLGHAAAVNAVMIHGNTIVSASGDRYIKSWDLSTGQFKKSYSGHAKGIACVQFDGRRIVSGSSDNTVRIFDADRQAEIACLSGHMNLVRTVQARFGDLDTVTDEELEAEARKADRGFFAAMAKGMQPASVSRRHGGGVRNPGSSRPEVMLTTGAKIPPGGGGSRWAKIVSGSYDENVIIWKKDGEGGWVVKHKLKQEILPSTSRHRSAVPGTLPAANTIAPPSVAQAQAQAHQHLATAHGHLAQASNILHANPQPGNSMPTAHLHSLANNVQSQHNQLLQATQQLPHGQAAHGAALQNANGVAPTNQQQTTTTQTGNAVNGVHMAPAAGTANAGAPQHQAGAGNAAAAHLGHHREGRDSNRVFKLQFDARRIICCSQNKVIVGWDFANGDPELERVGEWSLETP